MNSLAYLVIIPFIIAPVWSADTSANPRPIHLQLRVTPAKKQRSVPGSYFEDDKIQRVSVHIDIKNLENARELTGGKASIVVFASDLQDPDEFILIAKEEFNVELPPFKSVVFDTKPVKITFDKEGYKYGQKYEGYVLVVKDASGATLAIDAKPSFSKKYADDAQKLNVEDVFDKQFKFVKKGFLRN